MTPAMRRGIALATVAVLCAAGGCATAPPARPAAPAATSAGPVVPALPDDDGVVGAPAAAPDAKAQQVAEAFVRAWARPDLPASRWLAGVRPYAVPGYATMLADVDPANVPATAVTAPARPVLSGPTRADFDVPTDAGPVRVTCVRDGLRWAVATVSMPEPP